MIKLMEWNVATFPLAQWKTKATLKNNYYT